MPSAVGYYGKWRIKPSGQLPIFARFMINSAFVKKYAVKNKIKNTIEKRTYLKHMMYWPAAMYNAFEKEIIGHLKKNDGWFEWYVKKNLVASEKMYKKGLKYKKMDWSRASSARMKKVLDELLETYRELACGWYAQYPLDEYFETTIEDNLVDYISGDDHNFRKYVLIFTDPQGMTEVAEERFKLVSLAKTFLEKREDFNKFSKTAKTKIEKHLDKYAYINRGLATSKPYTYSDMAKRLKEFKKQVQKGKKIKDLIYDASEKKIRDDFKWALNKIKPKKDFLRIIKQARAHSYMRNRRVEAFFMGDYGADFMYREIARRVKFNPDWIMDVSVPEMYQALKGMSLPSKEEMKKRLKDYAMTVSKGKTTLITAPKKIKALEKQYTVNVKKVAELHGKMACLGGIIKGRAKICLDKHEIGKVKSGDILVAQFTTPDFVPAMEKAAAIIADQGGLSSHAAIVSRELGVPCVIATYNATRIIKDNDLLEINAHTGHIKILRKG